MKKFTVINVAMRPRYKKKRDCIKIGRNIKATSEILTARLEEKLLFP